MLFLITQHEEILHAQKAFITIFVYSPT